MKESLSLGAELDGLPRLAAWVERLAPSLGLDARRLHAVQLCLEEVVANLAMHASPEHGETVSVTVSIEADPLRVMVDDDALPFDTTAMPDPAGFTTLEEAQIGGLGLTLVRSFSATQDYARIAGRNRLTLGFDGESIK